MIALRWLWNGLASLPSAVKRFTALALFLVTITGGIYWLGRSAGETIVRERITDSLQAVTLAKQARARDSLAHVASAAVDTARAARHALAQAVHRVTLEAAHVAAIPQIVVSRDTDTVTTTRASGAIARLPVSHEAAALIHELAVGIAQRDSVIKDYSRVLETDVANATFGDSVAIRKLQIQNDQITRDLNAALDREAALRKRLPGPPSTLGTTVKVVTVGLAVIGGIHLYHAVTR